MAYQARSFGQLAAIRAAATWSSNVATLSFPLPSDREFMVLGIATDGAGTADGASQIVTDLSYYGQKFIQTPGAAIGAFPAGVPFATLGALGGQSYPAWHGNGDLLSQIVWAATLYDVPATVHGDRIRAARAERYSAALASLRYWSRQVNVDFDERPIDVGGQGLLRCPDLAGIILRDDQLTLTIQDATAGTDQSTGYTLWGVVLNQKPGQADQFTSVTYRGVNTPLWFNHPVTAIGTSAGNFTLDDKFTAYPQQIGGQAYSMRATVAQLLLDSGGEPNNAELFKLLVNDDSESIGIPFFWNQVPLSSFAQGGVMAPFQRPLYNGDRLVWDVRHSALAAASKLYLTDYLLSLPAGYA